MHHLFRLLFLFVLLLTASGTVWSDEPDLCSAFKNSNINNELLGNMLSAAKHGQLYQIQKKSSQVGFCVDSKLATIKGKFTEFEGGITLSPETSSNGKAMILIQAKSLDTENGLISTIIKSEQFFDVKNHPEVLFVSRGFKWTGRDTAILQGDLTLRGVTRRVTFNVLLSVLENHPAAQAQKILVKATTVLNRTEFGMKTLPVLVNKEVKLCLSVEALRYSS